MLVVNCLPKEHVFRGDYGGLEGKNILKIFDFEVLRRHTFGGII